MATSDFVIVILAAGKGTRLKSSLAKVLHRAGGRSLVEHVVRACQPLKPREIVAVVGHQAEDVTAAVAPLGVKTALAAAAARHGPRDAGGAARDSFAREVRHRAARRCAVDSHGDTGGAGARASGNRRRRYDSFR